MENEQKQETALIKPLQLTELSMQLTDGLIKQEITAKVKFKEIASQLTYGGAPNFALIIAHGTQLSTIKRVSGDQFLATVLGLVISDFQSAFNLIRPLTDDQIADVVMELIADYWGYKIEDFVAFFQLAKRGVYGKILDRLDPNTLFSMLAQYDAERVRDLAASQARLQESKGNPYAEADRQEQNGVFVDRGAPIRDFIDRVKGMQNKEV